MAERYSRLYSLPENLYAPGAPLVIAAGALLADRQSDQLLAQLRMRSISSRPMDSVTLLIIGRSESGEELCRQEHSYTNLGAARDAVFGAKDAVRLPDSRVRSFSVQVPSVSFADGGSYSDGGKLWSPLPAQTDLNQRLFDTELIRQYRLETGKDSRFVPLETQDLWLCACGEVNHRGESCFHCGQTLQHCKEYLNVSRLREEKSLRLNAEAAQAALDEARLQSRGRLLKRILCVLIPLLLIAAAACGVYMYSSRKATIYQAANELFQSGEYAFAAVQYEKLGRYRDAPEMAEKAKKAEAEISAYSLAGRFMENGRFEDAYETYTELGDYLDSAQLALEARYREGMELIENGGFEDARALFSELGGYRDAGIIVSHFFDRLLSEEISLNPECGGPLTTTYCYDSHGRIAKKTELFSAYEGMSDRVYEYSYGEDGGWTVSDGQTEKRYDAQGNYLGTRDRDEYTYLYEFYDDGTIRSSAKFDAKTKELVSGSTYDEHGNTDLFKSDDGTARAVRNEYRDGLLVKQESYDEDGSMLNRTNYEYDAGGRLKRTTFLTPGAETTIAVLYSYGPVYIPDAES